MEWVSSSSSGSPQPRDQTHTSCVSCIGRRVFTTEPPGNQHSKFHSKDGGLYKPARLSQCLPYPNPASSFSAITLLKSVSDYIPFQLRTSPGPFSPPRGPQDKEPVLGEPSLPPSHPHPAPPKRALFPGPGRPAVPACNCVHSVPALRARSTPQGPDSY